MAALRHILFICMLLAPAALAHRGPLSMLSETLGLPEAHAGAASASTTCTMCTFVIDRVKAGLNDTTVQATILDKLLQVCSSLPAELVTECTDLVKTYEPVLCQFIEAADSQHLCTLLGVCSDAAMHAYAVPQLPSRRSLLSLILAKLQGQANDSCDVCKMTVIEAHSLVTNPSVQASLVNYTKSLCASLGDAYTKACQDYIDVYAPALFDLLEKFLASDALCVDLGICQASLVDVLTVHMSRLRAAVKAHNNVVAHNAYANNGFARAP